MEPLQSSVQHDPPGSGELSSKLKAGRRILIGLTACTVLLGGFFAVEYWRGKRAWEKCKQDLRAKGAVLDWASLKPPAVTDGENFFKAPEMANWFAGNTPNALTEKLSLEGLAAFGTLYSTQILAEVTFVSPETPVTEAQADVVLQYGDSLLALSSFDGNPEPPAEILPVIVMEDVPLADAIRNLARHAELNYLIDARTQLGISSNPTLVSFRWENVTARQALTAVLDNYSLELVGSIQGGITRIRPKTEGNRKVEVRESALARIETLLDLALRQAGNEVPVGGLPGAQQIGLLQHPLKPVKPLRVFVRTEESPTGQEVVQFFPPGPFSSLSRGRSCYEARALEPNSFQISLQPRTLCSASDYLAWSDRCQPQFDLIREALKRPFALMDDTGVEPAEIPFQNFITVRLVVQTLAQRAQCHLLLNQPEAALQELTMMHHLRRILEGKPTTIVAAMINVVVAAIYVETVADGLRLKVWRAPQLTAIQAQLQEVNLAPPLVEAFQWERLYRLQELENGHLVRLMRHCEMSSIPSAEPTRLQKLRYGIMTLAPRGWVFQNMATIGSIQQEYLDAVDGKSRLVFPRQIDTAWNRQWKILSNDRPYSFIAAAVYPMFTRAWQTMAKNQTLANEAVAACALERHLQALGHFPKSLEALVPEFASQIPQDVINGGSLFYQQVGNTDYALYSVGWNGIDNGGSDVESDWIWGRSSQ